jgi:hypothetical protein
MSEYQPRCTPQDADPFLQGYLDCAEWCGLSDEDREAFELSVAPKWSTESIEQACADRADFVNANAEALEGIDPEQAGHDFYLTRNRHGAGFWDRGLGERGKLLTKASHAYGDATVYFDPETETLHLL